MSSSAIDLAKLIDNQKVSRLQLRIVLLGAATLMIDGFDNQMIAYVAPALKAAWHLDGGALGPVFGAGVTGVGLGSLVIGPFGDRLGRARVLLFTVLGFAVLAYLHAQARDVTQLMILRFCIGLVLGAVIPMVVVLCNEYAPQRHRAKMVTLVTCGYGIGAATGGYVSIHLVPAFGWQSIFYVGAIAPLFLAAALAIWMPESIRFLALKQDFRRIRAILSEINPRLVFDENARFTLASGKIEVPSGPLSKLRDLFAENRAWATTLLWICLFMNLIVLNFMNNWLPTLVIETGVPEAQALRAATALQIGGVIGIACIGVLVDRFGYYKVLACIFGVGGLFIAAISFAGTSLVGLVVAIFGAGFSVIGSQMTLGALSATLYPTRIRATGSSWAFGVGRLLSIVGPLLGGVMISQHWHLQTVFLCVAAPLFVAAISMMLMMRVERPAARAETVPAPSGGVSG